MARPRALATAAFATVIWLGAFLWLYEGPPPGRAWVWFVLPELAAAAAGLGLALAAPRDLTRGQAASALAAVGLVAGLGAAWLRERQEVDAPGLARIYLDRRADGSGERPRSNLTLRTHEKLHYRTLELLGVVANDNDFPVWEVELAVRFLKDDREWTYPLTLRADLPARGGGAIAWARRFSLEELPRQPEWEVKVLRARRHWGGGPRPGV